MSELTPAEIQQTASAYDELLVPALFKQWADHMASVAGLERDDQVLDVACGTGILARAVFQHLGSVGAVTGLDINPGMLAVAREKNPDIEWREGNAESLDFDDHSFDVVMCQFGLMLLESPDKALQEMWRVLRPGGRLLVAVFNALDHVPAYAAAADVYEQVVGPAVGNALRFPFSLGDPDKLKALFHQAGIARPVVTTHTVTAQFNSARHMVLSDVKGWFPFAGIDLEDETINQIEKKVRSALHDFILPSGEVQFDVSVQLVEVSK